MLRDILFGVLKKFGRVQTVEPKQNDSLACPDCGPIKDTAADINRRAAIKATKDKAV